MKTIFSTQFRFPFGQILLTPAVQERLTPEEYMAGLGSHLSGDWGDLDAEDFASNDEALVNGDRLFSAYGKGERRFWVITEADRSVTTILLPEDY